MTDMIERVARKLPQHIQAFAFDDLPKDQPQLREWTRAGKEGFNCNSLTQDDFLELAQVAIEEMDDWQPIETALKDGTEMQGWLSCNKDSDAGYWEPVIRYETKADQWQCRFSHGWFYLPEHVQPTHHKPLPEPPRETA